MPNRYQLTLCLMFAMVLPACGGPRPVEGGTDGTLRLAGAVLAETQVTVHEIDGGVSRPIGFAVTDSDGNFQLVTNGAQGPLKLEPGDYRFTLESAGAPVQFPPAYTKPETTPLKRSWSEEDTELDLEVPGWD